MLNVQIFLKQTVAILASTLGRETDPDNRRIIRRLLRQQERQLADLERCLSVTRLPTSPERRNLGDIEDSVTEHRVILRGGTGAHARNRAVYRQCRVDASCVSIGDQRTC